MPLDKNELKTFNRLFAAERLSFAQQLRSNLNIAGAGFIISEQEKSYQDDVETVSFFLDILKKNDFDCEKTITYIGQEEIEKLSVDFLNQYLNKITEKLISPDIYIHSENTRVYCSIIHSVQTLKNPEAWSFCTSDMTNMLQTFLTYFQINKAEILDIDIELLIEQFRRAHTKEETENDILDQIHNCHKISLEQLRDFLTNKSEDILQECMRNITNNIKDQLNLIIHYFHIQKLTKEETVTSVIHALDLQEEFLKTEEYIENEDDDPKNGFREISIYHEQKKSSIPSRKIKPKL